MPPDTDQVSFDENPTYGEAPRETSKQPFSVRLVLKYLGGYVKTEKQAYGVLMGIIVVAVCMIFFTLSSSSKTTEQEDTARMIEAFIQETNAVH